MAGSAVVKVAALVLLVLLGGCGKRGAPQPPGPAGEIIYPHSYPTR